MSGRTPASVLARRALRITQATHAPLYMFTLTAGRFCRWLTFPGSAVTTWAN